MLRFPMMLKWKQVRLRSRWAFVPLVRLGGYIVAESNHLLLAQGQGFLRQSYRSLVLGQGPQPASRIPQDASSSCKDVASLVGTFRDSTHFDPSPV